MNFYTKCYVLSRIVAAIIMIIAVILKFFADNLLMPYLAIVSGIGVIALQSKIVDWLVRDIYVISPDDIEIDEKDNDDKDD